MNENPFASPETTGQPDATDQEKRLVNRLPEIFHNMFRGMLAFFCLGFIPVFIVPSFKAMFEEFGIELPFASQCVLRFSNVAVSLSYAFLPLTFGLLAAIEVGIFWLPKRTLKILINVTYSLMLILVFGLLCLSLWLPMQIISTSI